MANRPEDDWTRPVPRTPRAGGTGPRSDDPDQTQRIPREERGGGGARGGFDGGRGREHDQHDDRWHGGSSGRPDDRHDDRHDERYGDRYDDRYDDRSDRRPGVRRRDRYDEGYEDHYEDRYDDPPARRTPTGSGRPPRRRPRYRVRRVLALVALLLVAYLVSMIVVVAMVWGSIDRVDAAPDAADRPGSSAGANYLLVGTDSREELTEDQRSEFATGYTEGHRADTVMLLHVPTFGDPTLVSLPRDSYVEIRDYGWHKLNSAHSFGGPELLVDTVEQSTGLRIEGYLEIGFGGFVNVVEQVGGVEMCLDAPIQDTRAHLDLEAGCQELTGAEALGYVRMRYSDPRGDLGRVERQREFLSALVDRLASPSTVLVPWRLHQVGTATGGSLSFSEDTSMLEGARMALAMRSVSSGSGTSVTVPVADADHPTNVGSTVLWDEQGASALFTALRNGDQVTVEP